MIVVDPKIEQAFAEVLTRSRHGAADITDRLAAERQRIAERSARIHAEGKQLSEEMDRRVEAKKQNARNPWQAREARPTVLSFGDDDDEQRHRPAPPPPAPAAPPPPATPYPAVPAPAQPAAPAHVMSFGSDADTRELALRPPPAPRPQRPVEDDDDDWSGRSWVRR